MRTAVVYRAYGAAGDLLYVGMTGNLAERIRGHRSERPWWTSKVVEVQSDPPTSRRKALAAERDQIQRLQPKYNERRWFRDNAAAYSFRIAADKLDQMHEIAEAEYRTLTQKLRSMIDEEIARHKEKPTEPKAA